MRAEDTRSFPCDVAGSVLTRIARMMIGVPTVSLLSEGHFNSMLRENEIRRQVVEDTSQEIAAVVLATDWIPGSATCITLKAITSIV